jgi:hypothetical protein
MTTQYKFGLSSFSEKAPSFGQKQDRSDGPRIPFIKLKEGNNVIRIITEPYKYYMARFKADEDEKGFGTRINFSEPTDACPLKKAGYSPKARWLVGIIDRAESQVAIYDFSVLIYEPLNNLNDDLEWQSPIGYDVTIRKNSKAPPASFYSIMPRGKSPLSPSDIALRDANIDKLNETLARLTTPPSAEKVLAKMQEAGYKGGLVVTPKYAKSNGKAELAEASSEDYNFDRPSAQA